VWAVVPETRGKTLEQIEGQMTGRMGDEEEPNMGSQIISCDRILIDPNCVPSIGSLSTTDSMTFRC
jgi:hypothetical protein